MKSSHSGIAGRSDLIAKLGPRFFQAGFAFGSNNLKGMRIEMLLELSLGVRLGDGAAFGAG